MARDFRPAPGQENQRQHLYPSFPKTGVPDFDITSHEGRELVS